MLTSTVLLTVFLESSNSDFNQVILVPVLNDTTMKSLCIVAFIPYHMEPLGLHFALHKLGLTAMISKNSIRNLMSLKCGSEVLVSRHCYFIMRSVTAGSTEIIRDLVLSEGHAPC